MDELEKAVFNNDGKLWDNRNGMRSGNKPTYKFSATLFNNNIYEANGYC